MEAGSSKFNMEITDDHVRGTLVSFEFNAELMNTMKIQLEKFGNTPASRPAGKRRICRLSFGDQRRKRRGIG